MATSTKIIIVLVLIIIGMASKPKKKHKKYNNYPQYPKTNYSNYQNSPVHAEPESFYNEDDWKFVKTIPKKSYFDSALERKTFYMLCKEVGKYANVYTHMHLNELFTVVEQPNKELGTYFNKLWTCHIDFVITEKNNPAKVLFAVEVDGHEAHKNNEKTILNDEFKTKVFNDNNILLVRVAGVFNPTFNPDDRTTFPMALINTINTVKNRQQSNTSVGA